VIQQLEFEEIWVTGLLPFEQTLHEKYIVQINPLLKVVF
jgi:hypothetical protein